MTAPGTVEKPPETGGLRVPLDESGAHPSKLDLWGLSGEYNCANGPTGLARHWGNPSVMLTR